MSKDREDISKTQNIKKEDKKSYQNSKIIEMEEKILSLEEEIKEKDEKNIRLLAEIQNINKQNEIEQIQNIKKGKKILAMNIVTFLSTLNIAFAYTPKTEDENVNNFVQTLKKSYEKLQEELKKCGVELIVPSVGDDFNSLFMEALNPCDEEHPKVKNIASIGIKIDNQLVQPAKVML